MSADRDRPQKTEAAEAAADLPPAASLLSVPIFRAAARQQAARASARAQSSTSVPKHAPVSAEPSTASQPLPETAAEPPAPGGPYAVVGGTDGGAREPVASGVPRQAPTLQAVEGERGYRTLLDYWRTLARQGRAPVEKLDADLIAARWPFAMLIRVPRDGVVDITHMFAPDPAAAAGDGEQTPQHPFARDQASQISSWLLEIAQEVAGSRQPARHTETFQQAGRPRRITAELLPCQAASDKADYLLLQLRDG